MYILYHPHTLTIQQVLTVFDPGIACRVFLACSAVEAIHGRANGQLNPLIMHAMIIIYPLVL